MYNVKSGGLRWPGCGIQGGTIQLHYHGSGSLYRPHA